MQHVRPPRLAGSLAVSALFAFAVAFAPGASVRVSAQQAQPGGAVPSAAPGELSPNGTPTPGSVEQSPTPEASETPGNAFLRKPGQHRAPTEKPSEAPSPSPTPTSPAFATLDGTWEVQVQHPYTTDYSYLVVTQGENGVISGSWRLGKISYPFEGTYDGRLIKLVVKEPTGDVTLSGYVETASDMVGLVDFGAGKGDPVAFTAEHRSHPKGLRNIQ